MHNLLRKFGFLIIGLFFLAPPITLLAQNDDVSVSYHQAPNTSVKANTYNQDLILEKIAVGGDLGLTFGSYTYFGIQPDISYHFNEWIAVGMGGTYAYRYYRDNKISEHLYGTRAFVEGHLFNVVGVHVVYEAMNLKDYQSQMLNDRIWANNISLGGGYYQRTGRFSVYFYCLYYVQSDRPEYFRDYYFKTGFHYFLK
jgi:hypothetical protein